MNVLAYSFFLFLSSILHPLKAALEAEVYYRERILPSIDEGCHQGATVTIHVNSGQNNIWHGELRFVNSTKFSLARGKYDFLLEFKYDVGDDTANYLLNFPQSPLTEALHVINENNKEKGKFKTFRLKGNDRVAGWNTSLKTGRKFGWKLDGTPWNVDAVINKILLLLQANPPRYKYSGYDWHTRSYNCISFSSFLLRGLGVQIQNCADLNSWLDPYPSGGFFSMSSHVKFVVHGATRFNFLGWTKTFPGADSISSEWLVKKISENSVNLNWIQGNNIYSIIITPA